MKPRPKTVINARNSILFFLYNNKLYYKAALSHIRKTVLAVLLLVLCLLVIYDFLDLFGGHV